MVTSQNFCWRKASPAAWTGPWLFTPRELRNSERLNGMYLHINTRIRTSNEWTCSMDSFCSKYTNAQASETMKRIHETKFHLLGYIRKLYFVYSKYSLNYCCFLCGLQCCLFVLRSKAKCYYTILWRRHKSLQLKLTSKQARWIISTAGHSQFVNVLFWNELSLLKPKKSDTAHGY